MEIEFTDSQKASKVFVLGATGFIGAAVVRRLVVLGFTNVHCLYRDEKKRAALCAGIDAGCLSFLHGDVSRPEVLREGVKDAAVVLNAAGYAKGWGAKEDFWAVNVDAPRALVEMMASADDAAGAGQFIHISTAGVYGFSKGTKTGTSPLVVSDPLYTASKVESHAWLRERMAAGDSCPITTVAPTIVWGPQDRIYIPGIKEQLASGKLAYFAGAPAVDFVHIDDLADLIVRCFFTERAHNQEFMGNGPQAFTFKVYIDKIAEFAGLPKPARSVPIWLAMGMAMVAEPMTRWANRCDPEKEPYLTRLQMLLFTRPLLAGVAREKTILGYAPTRTFAGAIEGIRDYVRQLP